MASSPSAPRKPGCRMSRTRRVPARCRGWSGRTRPSPTRARNGSATRPRSAPTRRKDARPALQGPRALPSRPRRPSPGIRDYARHRALALLAARAPLGSHEEQAPDGARRHLQRAKRVWNLPLPWSSKSNPSASALASASRSTHRRVVALVHFAASEQDAAIFLTAAFTGLRRGELIGLRWRDDDFPASVIRVRRSYSYGALTVPKSGKARAIPLAPEVAQAIVRLSTRPLWTGEDDLVFPGETGDFLDGSAFRRRYTVAQQLAGTRHSASTTCATPSARA